MSGDTTSLVTRPYEPGDAREYVRLAADAFSVAGANARPTESERFVAHIHSDANPGGRSLATIAEHEGRVVGHLSGIPFRFRRRDGGELVCWQLGLFAVAADMQRGGLGAKLLRHQIAQLERERAGDCWYGYPNPRSLGLLLGWGLRPTAVVPAHVVLPRLAGGALRDARGAWELTTLDVRGAAQALERVRIPEPGPGRFVRDAAFFRWRFLGPDADRRYRFLALERRGGDELVLVALSEHAALGTRFTVLVDGVPDLTEGRLALALEAARIQRPRRPVYLTTNARWRGGPPRVRVPRRLDPRPVLPFLLPGSEAFHPELSQAMYLTGDWMSF